MAQRQRHGDHLAGLGQWQLYQQHRVGTEWKVVGVGDVIGDGRDDIVWRNDGGTTTSWLGQANDGFVSNAAVFASGVGAEWQVQNYDYLLL